MFFLNHIYLIPLFPAIGAAIMFFFGRKLHKQTVSAVCVGAVALTFIWACGSVIQYNSWAAENSHQPYQKILYTWLGTDTGHFPIANGNRGAGYVGSLRGIEQFPAVNQNVGRVHSHPNQKRSEYQNSCFHGNPP